ncbi:MAG TPA: hypothetical protein VFP26_10600 [Gemmatimonadaceae bacterium]|nr:hypothetical protein [Gemmatimonadaceae bacterium]
MFAGHEEYLGDVRASPAELFSALDDQFRLSAHMTKRSWKMGWGKMDIVVDAQGGHAVGSHIELRGRVFGVALSLDEVVTLREPPYRKRWETVGEPRLLVIGAYAMGFEIWSQPSVARIRVSIDYDLPRKGLPRVLGLLFGKSYARWCTRRMVRDAQRMSMTFARPVVRVS